ncbi:pilus assembly protein CpaB [Arthrobacter ulcerisalmonis]|uniref:RcpC/CpaB family pilus assembly protein n=1 Tax=Arthrobacter sp. B1I2 TaxID=3042263 RepID=UPI00277EDFDD|nr:MULTISPECIES: RcpC/CpaB family pilus assembly protein [Arthrobacter]MDQ0663582.1 pilus assembly protein CpaB [Arthrobacter ulcerisalmonis]MDQ0731465.1 pilus assembly protein CpaB [Arthrobacter sp. B1I2]
MPILPRRRDGLRFPTNFRSASSTRKVGRRPGKRPLRLRVAGWLSRNRRLAAALLLSAAAAITVQQITPAPLSTVTALAAARDLPAGTAVTEADLARVQVPPGMVADGFLREGAAAAGKQLAAPLRKGQLLTDAQLLGPGLLAGTPPGSAAVPLRMADASSIQLVSPGQLVNVVLTSANGFDQQGPSEVLASAVPVLWTSNKGAQSGQWLGTTETDGLIVVAANAEQSSRLAGASTEGKLFFVLVGPP